MEPSTKSRALSYVVVTAALAFILYQSGIASLISDQFPAEAVVESVNVVDAAATPPRKEAILRLAGGETVTARVPPACLVFPGQTVTVSYWRGSWGRGRYTVLGVKDAQ